MSMQSALQSRKEALHRLYRGIEKGDFAFAEMLFTADFISVEGSHQRVVGLSAFKNEVQAIHDGYTDPRFEILDMVAEGDDVMVRSRMSATHTGDLLGIPATGKRVSMEEFALFRFVGDHISERHAVSDRLGLLQQLRPD
ncbi:ester cyclase [Nonomuraea sp. NPDC049480]|uniref:ester cyclase n=1 Tax=Nonomuraea sp. NPDC049480 TaxID=3364353 RepID=UPI003792521E